MLVSIYFNFVIWYIINFVYVCQVWLEQQWFVFDVMEFEWFYCFLVLIRECVGYWLVYQVEQVKIVFFDGDMVIFFFECFVLGE